MKKRGRPKSARKHDRVTRASCGCTYIGEAVSTRCRDHQWDHEHQQPKEKANG